MEKSSYSGAEVTSNYRDSYNTIRFLKSEHTSRYNVIRNRRITPTHYVCPDTLSAMGIAYDVMRLMVNVRWWWFQIDPRPAYHRLTFEFLASLEIGEGEGAERKVTYQLMNTQYKSTVGEIESCFKMDMTDIAIGVDPLFNASAFYRQITGGDTYDAITANSRAIRHPAIRYVHRLLGLSVLGKSELDSVTIQDLQFL